MLLQSIPLVFVLAGLAIYTVLGGADFGAGFCSWSRVAVSMPGACASTRTTRWARCGRPTTCG